MTVLSPQQHTEVQTLLDELLDLSPASRAQRLAQCQDMHPQVLQEVLSLLKAADSVDGFLVAPAKPAADPVWEPSLIGARLGAWQITDRIGHGGMGEVFGAARAHGDFEQRVAIKLLQRDAAGHFERFQAERQILARLEHPGIARLYDGGVSPDGRPYMVMEFVDGVPITEFCSQMSCTLRQRLELFVQVCEAVAYAHRNLIVHRDLKPSNILVTADGKVKLLDFGIAKLVDAQHTPMTMTNLAPLTPRCAAPEQLSGKPVTTATDVYALGLLLFELLTGTHPWVGADTPVLQALRTVLLQPAPIASRKAASESNPPVPARMIRGDLDAIIAKTLRTEPTDRFATVEALKQDIELALRGDPVTAREGARLYVMGRLLRRYRWQAAALLLVLLSLTGGLSAALWQAHRAQIERDTARRDTAREEAVRDNLTRLFRSAITDQNGQPASAKAMIDGSAERVLREYRDQPLLAGQIVLALADLYGALNDVAGQRTLLEAYNKQPNADADPATIADVRQKLANAELLDGQIALAAQLLTSSEAFWAQHPQQFAEERLEGLGVRARQQRMSGDLEGSIRTAREAIAQRITLSGHDHRETAILYNSLAITLTSAARLDEALDAYRETTAIYQAIGLGDGLDAQVVLGNTGTLELRTGHLRQAEDLLKNAIDHERALAGDSAAVAAAMGNYGRLLSITNRNAQAIPTLREAYELGARYAGTNSPMTLQNQLYLAEALLAAGDYAPARVLLAQTHTTALAQYGAAHLLTLRTEMLQAQLDSATGRSADARAAMASVIAGLRKLGPSGASNLAQALEALGTIDLAVKQPRSAIDDFEEAVSWREKLPNQTWELAEARERLGEAQAGNGELAQGLSLLDQALQALQSSLGPDHPQTVRARDALAHYRG
jgi:tetratricopeptide (TPR) repeat protein